MWTHNTKFYRNPFISFRDSNCVDTYNLPIMSTFYEPFIWNVRKREQKCIVSVVFQASNNCNAVLQLPELLGREVLKEGERLADILSMPVKDALGRDVDVNYESDIANVLELLDATTARKNIFCDSVELHKLTLAQVSHIRAYERDAAQAVQWLDDLFQVSKIYGIAHVQWQSAGARMRRPHDFLDERILIKSNANYS